MTQPEQGINQGTGATNSGNRILVVDDEEVIRVLLTEILGDQGFEITTASGGQEAIDLIDSEQFDLIISDMVMPDVGGIEVLQAAFRVDPEYSVIIITGYPSVDTAVKLVNLGAADYVTKPFNVDIIKITVAKVLEMKKVRESSYNCQGPLAKLTGIDEATGAYNSTLFGQLLDNEIGRSRLRSQVCAVLMLNITGIESYTNPGDPARLLSELARAAKAGVRPGDTLGRTDEYEIGIILPETDSQEAHRIYVRIREEAHPNLPFDCGIVLYPEHAIDSDSMLRTARAIIQASRSRVT